jgi:hypothetical protein
MTLTAKLQPVVIGCTGGSGSRMMRDILAASREVHMDRNHSEYSKDSFGGRALLQHDPHSPDFPDRVREFWDSIVAQIAPENVGRLKWFGWKNPRHINIIDVLMGLDPRLHFIHLIRDPGAILNTNNPRKIRRSIKVFEERRAQGDPDAKRDRPHFVLANWARVNLAVWRKYRHDPRYCLVYYEDVLARPRECIESLFGWMRLNTEECAEAARVVNPPDGAVTRGRSVDLAEIAAAAAELGYGANGRCELASTRQQDQRP